MNRLTQLDRDLWVAFASIACGIAGLIAVFVQKVLA